MSKVLIRNGGQSAINVAGELVPTGSQRWVDPADITPGLKQYVVANKGTTRVNSPGDKVKAFDPESFLARGLKEMESELPGLSKEELNELKKRENSVEEGKPRKNVIDAIDVALLKAKS